MKDVQLQVSEQQINGNGKQYSVTSEIRCYRLPSAILQHIKKSSQSQYGSRNKKQVKEKKSKKTFIGRSIDRWKSRVQKVSQIQICPICEIQTVTQNLYSIGKCSHKFCEKCLSGYATYKINIYEEVLCPDQQCQEVLNKNGVIYLGLTKILKEKYLKIHQHQSIKKINNAKLCPNDQCDGILISNSQQINIQCQKCEIFYCQKCWMKSHYGSCDKHQILMFEAGLNYRQCKKCKRVVERVSGCDHITCMCGYQFCYLCGKNWSVSHTCNTTPQCCFQWPFCRFFWKIVYIILYFFIAYPIIILKNIAVIAGLIILCVSAGAIIQPFVILGELCQQNMLLMLLGLLFYPIVVIIGIIRVSNQIMRQNCQYIFNSQQCCSVCIMLSDLRTISQDDVN